MNRMMIDIETLDTQPTAVVLSVAAVVFNDVDVLEAGHWFLDTEKQIQHGRSISLDTICWWMEQGKGQAFELLNKTKTQGISPSTFSKQFSGMYGLYRVEELWANGIVFDVGILENLMATPQLDTVSPPWKYNHPRDLRTMYAHEQFSREDRTVPTLAHDALEDALAQTEDWFRMKEIVDCVS
jgi:hypothetical protein